MSRRLLRSYPFLFAAFMVLYRADRNPGYYTLDDLFLVLAVILGGLGVVYALAALFFRRRGRDDSAAADMPALITLLVALWLLAFPDILRQFRGGARIALGTLALAASVVIVWRVSRRRRQLHLVGKFLTLTGGLLVIRFTAGIAVDLLRERHAVSRSALARELARPIPGPSTVPGPVRDVYLIVLDEYANDVVLRDGLGFDNSAFLDSLRALGFHVPAVTNSNYAHTVLSLPSLLNAAHLYRVTGELRAGETNPTLVNYLLGHGRVPRFLQARGYRFVFFPSGWWGATRTNAIADSVVRVDRDLDVGRELSRTEFRRTIRKLTPLALLRSDRRSDADFVRRTLEAVERLPSVKEPTFAFVHLLSPHWPYVFDRACQLRLRGANGPRADYLDQLECLNGMVLATVNRLLRDSDVPPVILLQSDHGTAMLGFKKARTVEQVTPTAAWERFGAFGAYYLPDGGAAAFGDTVAVVNVLGDVLRYYLAADLPREPDERYLSVELSPFRFQQIDPAWLASPRSRPQVPRPAPVRMNVPADIR